MRRESRIFQKPVFHTLIGAGAAMLVLTGCAGQVPAGKEGAEIGEAAEITSKPVDNILLPMQAENGQWGYVDMEGNMVIFPEYDEVGAFNQDGMAYARIGKLVGYIDRSGNWVLGPKAQAEYFGFDKITRLEVNQEAIQRAGLADNPPQGFTVCGNWGYVGMDGNVVVPFRYRFLTLCDNGVYVAGCEEDGETKFGLLDKDGQPFLPFEYDYISENQSCGLMAFEKEGSCGFLSLDGKVAIGAKYDRVEDFSSFSGYAIVEENEKYGLIDCNGQEVVPPGYEYCFPAYYSEEERNKKDPIYFFSNEIEEIVIYNVAAGFFFPEKYDQVGDALYGAEGLIMAQQSGGKWGILDSGGNTVIDFKYDTLWYFNEHGQTEAGLKGRYGILDRDGKIVVPFKYDSIEWVSKSQLGPDLTEIILKSTETGLPGLIVATVKGKTIFYNVDGKKLLELEEPETTDIATGQEYMETALAYVQEILDGLGYEKTITLEDLEDYFENNVYSGYVDLNDIPVFADYKTGLYGIRDKEGKILAEPVYDFISAMIVENMYRTKVYDEETHTDNLGVIYVENGKAYVIPPEYDSVKINEEEVITVIKNDTSMLMNKYGEWIVKLGDTEAVENEETKNEKNNKKD